MNLEISKEYETYDEILDIDVLNNSLLLSVDSGYDAALVLLNENYDVVKEVEMSLTPRDIDTQILSNGDVVVTVASSRDTIIYLFDSNLNLKSKNNFLENNSDWIQLVNTAVNPINQKVYAVGHTNVTIGNIKNNGGYDGVVVSYDFKIDDTSDNTDVKEEVIINPQDTPVVPEDTSVVPKEETSTSDSIENPETGAKALGMTVLIFSCLIFIIKLITRRKIFNKI